MTTLDRSRSKSATSDGAANDSPAAKPQGTLRDEVQRTLTQYFQQLEGQPVSNLYDMVINEVEAPLLDAVMRYTDSNQSKASIMLGLNRGTLRKKLKQYGLL